MDIRSRRHPREEAVRLTRELAVAFDLQVTSSEDLIAGLGVYVRAPRLGAFDSMLAAVAANRDVRALVSADRAFAEVDGLAWLGLADPDLERLLVD